MVQTRLGRHRLQEKGGGFAKCGRSKQKKDAKRKYPKCVPRAKANRMTESQRRSAVSRKRSKAQGVGGKPTNVKTFAGRKKAANGGYIGSFLELNVFPPLERLLYLIFS